VPNKIVGHTAEAWVFPGHTGKAPAPRRLCPTYLADLWEYLSNRP